MRTIIFVWVAIFVISSYTIIEGRHISREDYFEAKRLVKLHRRPSVKIIQAENGDIFDCVIIDKQLAFEHPALKNHTIRMKPTFVPEWKKNEGLNRTSLYIGLKGGGCPIGSVLIRRLQISDILRSTSVSSFGRKHINGKRHYAVAKTYGEYLGVQAIMNVWNPKYVRYDQFSNSQLWIINNSPFGLMESIEAGWMVYPETFKDDQTRLFTYWTIDGYRNGCYNMECSAFTQVSKEFTVGSALPEMSNYNGRQAYVGITVFKDVDTGDWWLLMNEDHIGYWPSRIFNRLSIGKSTRHEWGGETTSDDELWPEMGSGHFPNKNNILGKSCTISSMKVYHGGNVWEDNGAFELYQSNPNCYRIIEGGNDPIWERNIAYGGPGGYC